MTVIKKNFKIEESNLEKILLRKNLKNQESSLMMFSNLLKTLGRSKQKKSTPLFQG